MNIRLAAERDIPQLAQMRWDFRTEHKGPPPGVAPQDFIAVCRRFLESVLPGDRWMAWVAEENGLILAHAFVQRILKIPQPYNFSAEFGYITNVYTRPQYRSRGIGAALMEEIKAWARQAGLEDLVLWPSEKSVAFYQRAGFQHPTEAMEYPVDG
jgi:GNAT superfamily N-acetyltransferase